MKQNKWEIEAGEEIKKLVSPLEKLIDELNNIALDKGSDKELRAILTEVYRIQGILYRKLLSVKPKYLVYKKKIDDDLEALATQYIGQKGYETVKAKTSKALDDYRKINKDALEVKDRLNVLIELLDDSLKYMNNCINILSNLQSINKRGKP